MAKTKMNVKVNSFFEEASQWQKEMQKLRPILLDCGLDEALKWNLPCYTLQGKNIVVIQPFKKYLALLFLKGALIQDTDGILLKTGENTHAGRQIRFNSVKEITGLEPILKTYIFQAIEVERAGLKVSIKRNDELDIPDELQDKFEKSTAFKKAFDALTPGRQRGYIFYFAQPKQSKTRTARIEKYLPQIMEGKGINDDYLATMKTLRER